MDADAHQPDFEDYLEGYFPLLVSIKDLMSRRAVDHVELTLTHAPIVQFDGLPDDAPIPLSARAGRVGMIRQAQLYAHFIGDTVALRGRAHWSWLDGGPTQGLLDPMMRLAEPAFVHGTSAKSTSNDREFRPPDACIQGQWRIETVVTGA